MATLVQPRPGDEVPRPNIPAANNRLPAVADYEQVDRDIIATLGPTLGWFAALATFGRWPSGSAVVAMAAAPYARGATAPAAGWLTFFK